ncbi:AEC family transporter [Paracoccus aerius]|uniref:AEC family transporter n=2 Tax=Paracoccus aerius TaxID=1915382 RepID=A0ABS1S8M9_9RHOB|nr:AEC family transporter [Paracoccus aerius]MBL3675091.1 AEC family transporter [Paracoccus aerius]GHG30881.1 transporter [Paracoccus aerius]
MQPILSILPVIALVALGHLLRRWRIIAPGSWPGIEQLGFRVLFPAILLVSIYRAELSVGVLGRYLGAMAVAFALTGAVALLLRRPLGLDNRRATSLFQGALRFNSLLILAVAAQGLGPAALGDLAVALAFLIPAFNIAAIVALTLLPGADAIRPGPGSMRRIGSEIARNPLVLGCAAGLLLNLSGVALPNWAMSPLDWLGQGALALGLLSVGAGIELRRLWQTDAAMWAGVALRLALCPAIFLVCGLMLSLPGSQIASGLLATAAPGASAGYILARQMGGDAEFFADIFTWQTVLAAASLPLWLAAAQMVQP